MEIMKASMYDHCTVFFSLPSFVLLLVKSRSVVALCFKCVACSGKGAGITPIFSHDTPDIVPYARRVSNDRGRQGGSRASILGFIGLVLVELFQKLGLSYVRCFFPGRGIMWSK